MLSSKWIVNLHTDLLGWSNFVTRRLHITYFVIYADTFHKSLNLYHFWNFFNVINIGFSNFFKCILLIDKKEGLWRLDFFKICESLQALYLIGQITYISLLTLIENVRLPLDNAHLHYSFYNRLNLKILMKWNFLCSLIRTLSITSFFFYCSGYK